MTNSNYYIPYGRQTITDEDIESVVNVLRSDYLTQGPMVPAFEQSVADEVKAKYGIAVNSATSALHIGCLALGLSEGDCLWTSPITFVASANCSIYCGASVDFVDIDPLTGLMSVYELERKLSQAKKDNCLPKIVIPVHLGGSSCDMKAIYELSTEYGFSVLEDASHAIGGSYKGTKVGSCSYSDITVFSFHPVKIITSAEGGMATTNDSDLAEKMYSLRSHGITKEKSNFISNSTPAWGYEQQLLGFNYRMNDLQAALGLSQLKRLEAIVSRRNNIWSRYQDMLNGLPIRLLSIPKDVSSALHLAIVSLDQQLVSVHAEIFQGLRAANIGVQLHYYPVHLQPYYQKLGFAPHQFPNSVNYSRSSFSLPIFPSLSTADQDYVVVTLSTMLSNLLP